MGIPFFQSMGRLPVVCLPLTRHHNWLTFVYKAVYTRVPCKQYNNLQCFALPTRFLRPFVSRYRTQALVNYVQLMVQWPDTWTSSPVMEVHVRAFVRCTSVIPFLSDVTSFSLAYPVACSYKWMYEENCKAGFLTIIVYGCVISWVNLDLRTICIYIVARLKLLCNSR